MKYLRLSIFQLTVFFSGRLLAEGNDPARVADSLESAGNYATAALYFEKAAFFSEKRTGAIKFTLRAARCLKKEMRYTEALELLSSAGVAGLGDSLMFEVKFQSAQLAYLSRDFARAESEIKQINYLATDSSLIWQTTLLHALVLHEQYRWQEAQQVLIAHVLALNRDDRQLERVRILDSIYQEENLPGIKSTKKALKIARWLPGMGQVYAGRPLEGIVSFGAITVTAGAMVFGILNQYYFTSLVLGNLIIGKFYEGSLKRAEFLVKKTNYERTVNFNHTLKNSLSATFAD